MGRLRLDIVNDDMVVNLKVTEKVENGAFGKVGHIVNLDSLDRETYILEKFVGTEKAGEIVFVAHDGHRYDERDYGFDVSVEAGEITRGYFLSRRDLISVEPSVLCGQVDTTRYAVGSYLKPKAGTYRLESTETVEGAVAVIEGIEKLSGYEVYVIRILG